LRSGGVDVLVNMLPTGSTQAVRTYATTAIEAGVAFVNGMATPIAHDAHLASLAGRCAVPIVGDDVKSQFGATTLHRALLTTLSQRGLTIDRTVQLDYAGNTDFCNLVARGGGKEASKLSALSSLVEEELTGLGDRKTAELQFEARGVR